MTSSWGCRGAVAASNYPQLLLLVELALLKVARSATLLLKSRQQLYLRRAACCVHCSMGKIGNAFAFCMVFCSLVFDCSNIEQEKGMENGGRASVIGHHFSLSPPARGARCEIRYRLRNIASIRCFTFHYGSDDQRSKGTYSSTSLLALVESYRG